MNTSVIENNKQYVERLKFYRTFGYDLTQEREFVLDCAGSISGAVLEIGTGKGHCALALAKRGVRFISIDVSAQEQEIAALNLEYYGVRDRVDMRVMDAQKLAFIRESFDMLFCVNVFHHVQHPRKVLKEMQRVVKKQGRVIISDFTSEGMNVINRCHEAEGKKHDHFLNDINYAANFFTAAGFSVEYRESTCQAVIIAER